MSHKATLIGMVLLGATVPMLLASGCAGVRQDQTQQPKDSTEALTPLVKLPEITSESVPGEYFRDLIFHIQEHKRLADGAEVVRAAGFHKNEPLAFEVAFGPNWESGSLGNDLVSYSGIVTYRSVGVESDSFIRVLDEIYDVKLNPKKMRKETVFAALTLAGNPQDLNKGEVKMKLFYESNDQDKYAELYTNIDLSSRTLHLNEKDPDYRAPVIRALGDL